jgi:hypothetical protein
MSASLTKSGCTSEMSNLRSFPPCIGFGSRCGWDGQSIEVIFVERSLGDWWRHLLICSDGASEGCDLVVEHLPGLNFVHIPRHQLDTGILKFLPLSLSMVTHPTMSIALFRSHNLVVSFPGEAPGYIRKFGPHWSRVLCSKQQLQSWLEHRVVTKCQKCGVPGKPNRILPSTSMMGCSEPPWAYAI